MQIAFENKHIRLKNCRYGPMLYLPADQYIGQALDKYGEFSEGEIFFLRSFIRSDWTVLDLGANHGSHTVAFAKVAKIVHAFEPQRILFQLLCANVALNALTNVYTHQAAVGRSCGTINVPTLNYTKSGNFGAVVLGGTGGEEVPLVTVDSLALPACHFIKMDVEGSEGLAILGMASLFERNQIGKLIIEFYPPRIKESGLNPADCLKVLLQNGFKIYNVDNEIKKIEPINGDGIEKLCEENPQTCLLCIKQ